MTVGWPRAGPLLGGMIMTKPNLIYILADDMGYGDISALNENCGFRTPNLDEMAESASPMPMLPLRYVRRPVTAY